MFVLNQQDQRIIELSQQDYLPLVVESFLLQRQAVKRSLDEVLLMV